MDPRHRRSALLARLAAVAVVAAVALPMVAGTAAGSSPLFTPYRVTAVGGTTTAVAVGDVTGDGRSDVVATVSVSLNDQRIAILAGLPDGTLATAVSYPAAGFGTNPLQTVAVGDTPATDAVTSRSVPPASVSSSSRSSRTGPTAARSSRPRTA